MINHAFLPVSFINYGLEESLENLQQLALHAWGRWWVERHRQTHEEGEREAFLRCPMHYAHSVLFRIQAAQAIYLSIYLSIYLVIKEQHASEFF